MDNLLVIKRLYNLSHDQMEYQINDRISFRWFPGLDFGDMVLDAKMIWLYEDMLSQNEAYKELFGLFIEAIKAERYMTRTGLIVDAFFVEASKRRNTKEQREQLKRNVISEEWVVRNIRRNLRSEIRRPHG
jgi:IS5 family transposase